MFPSTSPFFFPVECSWSFKNKICNLNQHLSLFTTFTVPLIGEIILSIDVSTSPVVKDQTDRGLNWHLSHLAAMLKEKTPTTRRETRKTLAKLTCRFCYDSLKSSLSINLKTASNNPSAWSSENFFISSWIAQGRPPVFVMTVKRHQEFSTNFSIEDSRIISEKVTVLHPFIC